MIVCVCNNINCKTIRKAVGDKPEDATYTGTYKKLGHRPKCGKCMESFNQLLAEMRADKAAQQDQNSANDKKPRRRYRLLIVK